MNEHNNLYYHQQPMMPPQQPRGWRQPILRAKDAFPSWLSQYSMVAYILALAVVSFLYSDHSLPWYYMLSGVVAVMVFFLYGGYATKNLAVEKVRKEKTFEKKIFLMAFIPRVVFMLLIYWIFQENYGNAFGFENGDPTFYDEQGAAFAGALRKGNFTEVWKYTSSMIDISDLGYAVYVGLIYWLTGSGTTGSMQLIGDAAATSALSILTVRMLKCVLSAITVVLIYRIAKRNFGEQTGRISAIFCALWPNYWYYCGTHLKEVEMVFLAVLFVEQADQMLRSRQFTAWKVVPILLIAAAMFTVRTPLGLVAILALVFSVVMSSSRVVNWGKRIIIGILAILLLFVVAGNRLEEKSNELFNRVQADEQRQNMEWRARRDNGNAFAKYAGKSVFAPLIFTIPFPSMVRPYDGQDVLQIVNGGNFVKNIISAFTIFALAMLLMSGKWRDHLLPLSFMLGYLAVLVMSTFAQSERFHQPATPFEFMFAAYGLSIALTKPKYKRWFTYWCGLMFVACIAWNWFKMAGRGLA